MSQVLIAGSSIDLCHYFCRSYGYGTVLYYGTGTGDTGTIGDRSYAYPRLYIASRVARSMRHITEIFVGFHRERGISSPNEGAFAFSALSFGTVMPTID
jgi:hypothetical protein